MAELLDLVIDTFPATDDVGVPLSSTLTITLSGLDYDSSSLIEGCFLEGPDTDQFVGPGLDLLIYPDNVSQGALDDFLRSPGYQGIAEADVTVSGIGGHTVISLKPTLPLTALTDYVLNLTYVLEADGDTPIEGHITIPFQSGSGSIEVVPSTTSTSILARTSLSPLLVTTSTPFKINAVTPKDHSVQNPITLEEIVVEFNKNINPLSVSSASIKVEALPVTDHPNISIQANGELAKQVTVEGNKLKIKI